MSLYQELLERKSRGERLCFDSISYDELFELWYVEAKSDEIIAQLFDVSKRDVFNRRKKEGMLQGEAGVNHLLRKYMNELQTIGYSVIDEESIPERVKELLQKLTKLEDTYLQWIVQNEPRLKLYYDFFIFKGAVNRAGNDFI
ncbi:MAG: hypothetical protein JG781_410 [Peptococcaceae bacterium]|nr:hypothetical protein [Peptococcaceae bacterium]